MQPADIPARDVDLAASLGSAETFTLPRVRQRSHRHEYEYESGCRFTARASLTRTSVAFPVSCTSTNHVVSDLN